ncbi:ABC transporter transmembrane domain-containing protein [Streptomyces sp. NBC_00425]|uniref:ABC transporter transmembrane domain-containing protein n=1 Tax=Streptomyces sp. NBC_00425 TaxID=2975740 RepID=UPI003FCD964D
MRPAGESCAWAGERASLTTAHRLRAELVARVLAPEGGAEEGRLPGELATIATEDAKRVGAVMMALIVAVASATGLAVGAVVLLGVSLPLGLLALTGAPLLLWLAHLLSRPLERRSETEQEQAARASGVAADLVAGLRILKGIGAERTVVSRYRRISQESLTATLRAARAEAWQNAVVTVLTGVFLALVALVGGQLAARGDIGVGELVSSVALALFLIGPLSEFSWVYAELAQGRASAGRIAGVLDAEQAVSPAPAPGRIPVPRAGGGPGLPLRLRGLAHGPLRDLHLDVARPSSAPTTGSPSRPCGRPRTGTPRPCDCRSTRRSTAPGRSRTGSPWATWTAGSGTRSPAGKRSVSCPPPPPNPPRSP